MKVVVWLCSLMIVSCNAAREREQLLARRIEALERSQATLGGEWEDVRRLYTHGASEAISAQADYVKAREVSGATSVRLNELKARWEEAEKNWEFARQLVLVAAAIDAGNLEKARESRAGRSKEPLNCERVSTAAYRRTLESQGIDLTGKDIDHIVPHALGGADHPSNYQVLDSSLNRSLGAAWGRDKCLMAGKKCAEAVAVSKKCGSFEVSSLGF